MFWWIVSASLKLEAVVLATALALTIFTVHEFRSVPVDMPAESARVRADMRPDATASGGVLNRDVDYHRNGEPSRAGPRSLPGSWPGRESFEGSLRGFH